jgi:hypothetical protein
MQIECVFLLTMFNKNTIKENDRLPPLNVRKLKDMAPQGLKVGNNRKTWLHGES